MVGLILPNTLKYSPYIQYYIKAFDENNISYEILSWDKLGLNENVAHVFRYTSKDNQMLRKTMGYVKFRNWVIRTCRKQKYDKIIVFTLAPAVILSDFLQKEYRGKYYLDIRDDTILRKVMKKQIQKIIDGASGVISSSKEFDSWICRDNLICHNVDSCVVRNALEESEYPCKAELHDPGRHSIMFAGMLNEWEINRELVKMYANAPQVSFIFHAPDSSGKQTIVDDCEENHITNVTFYGAYKKEEIYGMYRCEADWVNIIRRESVVNRNALPNKLYDAMVAGVPVIVLSHNKAVCDYVVKFHLGLVFDSLEDMKAQFIQRAEAFDYRQFAKGRENFLKEVLDASEKFEERITAWANSEE